MLRQEDFIEMLGELQNHAEKTIGITDELVAEVDDRDFRYKLIALRQTKFAHLETMTALKTMLIQNLQNAATVQVEKVQG